MGTPSRVSVTTELPDAYDDQLVCSCGTACRERGVRDLVDPMGITPAGVGAHVGQVAVAIVVAPSVIRQYRQCNMAPGFAPGATLVAQGGPAIGPLLDPGVPLAPCVIRGRKGSPRASSDDDAQREH